MSRRDDVLKRAPRLSQVAWSEAHSQKRARPSYVAASELYADEDRESQTRAVRPLYDDNEATRSPQQSYVDLAGLRSFDEETQIGVPRPSHVAHAELASSSSPIRAARTSDAPESVTAFHAARPSYVAASELADDHGSPRASYVAAKELHDEDRCEMATVTGYVVRPSYVASSERVDVYAHTEKLHELDVDPLSDSDDELSSNDIEVIGYDRLAHTDEQPVVEPERLDLDALGRYLFDDCILPPPPEPPRPRSPSTPDALAPAPARSQRVPRSSRPAFEGGPATATPSEPPPGPESLLPRLAQIQRVMEQRQRALSFLPEEEVRPSELSRRSSTPPQDSWGSSPWGVPSAASMPTLEPPMMFGLPTPPPHTSQSLRPVLAPLACAAVGLLVAALIALVVVFARPDGPSTQARTAAEAPAYEPAPVLVATAEQAPAPPSFISIGDPPEDSPVVAPEPSQEAPSSQASVAPAAPASPQKVQAPAAGKPEATPAGRAKGGKAGGKSVEEILAELGEEQLRR